MAERKKNGPNDQQRQDKQWKTYAGNVYAGDNYIILMRRIE